ncbi:MAG: cation:proton antiporter [Clostridia bacterium]|nr:cation:proton antiporter [Clostridia bacterium]
MNILLSLAFAMIVGLLLTRVVKLVHLPNVTGYLIAGLLIGPYVLNVFPNQSLEVVGSISTVALGFIAFSIGNEFRFSHLKHIGKNAIIICFCQALLAALLVDVALILAGFDTPLCLVLGAIATATAPAATLMVVRQYKAKGPITNTLLPVVAIDDAIGLIVFAVSLAIAKSLSSGAAITVMNTAVEPLLEIVLSLVVGGVIGVLVSVVAKFFKSRANRLCICIAAVFLGVALAEQFHLSSLLLCMCIGAGFVNTNKNAEPILDGIDRWTPPLFMLFFVISGAELDLAVLPTVGVLGLLYLLVRSAGKYFGTFFGAMLVKSDKNIRNYLGAALLPQAGVAIGMAQIVMTQLPAYGQQVRAVVLTATLIYELVGPLITKIVLTKAGEIVPEKKKKLS